MGIDVRFIKEAEALFDVDGLILPGGESTTISKLLERFGFGPALRRRVAEGMGILGTCAGAILMARSIVADTSPFEPYGFLDIQVERNAYGRQVESFEADIVANRISLPALRGVFIRAPIIRSCGPSVEIAASFEGNPVWVLSGKMVAATFHPELAGEERIHRDFLDRLG